MAENSRSPKVVLPEEITGQRRLSDAEKAVLEDPRLVTIPVKRRNLLAILMADPKKTIREAAIEAGYSKFTNITMLKRQIQGSLSLTLRDAGVSEHDLGRAIAEGLSATRPLVVRTKESKIPENGNGGKKEKAVFEDKITIFDVPDYEARHKYLKTVLELGGYFAPKKIDITGRIAHGHVHRIFDKIPADDLDRLVRHEMAMLEESGAREIPFDELNQEETECASG